MSATIPPALKTADVARFAHRAGQLEKARPAVAYWCNYWIVEQIISKNMHQVDEDSKAYTMRLMDKLEQIKTDFAENDAITDDMAGHAYIEQFGQETFQRADNAMKANKASRQTADTFQAAATFLEICQIWGPLESEIASKIKFAKYHALRIAKALKAGADPNLTNPKPEVPPDGEKVAPHANALSHQEADLNGMVHRQPSVEDIPDGQPEFEALKTQAIPQNVEHYYQHPPAPDVSPLAPSSGGQVSPNNNGYFPQISDDASRIFTPQPPISPLPGDSPGHPSSRQLPETTRLPPLTVDVVPPSDLQEPSIPPSIPESRFPHKASVVSPKEIPQAPVPPSRHTTTSVSRDERKPNFKDDEGSVMAAQKHARFAISALNFEDVPTAVSELRAALESLGVAA